MDPHLSYNMDTKPEAEDGEVNGKNKGIHLLQGLLEAHLLMECQKEN